MNPGSFIALVKASSSFFTIPGEMPFGPAIFRKVGAGISYPRSFKVGILGYAGDLSSAIKRRSLICPAST